MRQNAPAPFFLVFCVNIKIGVGKKPTPEYDLAAWVLGKLPKEHTESIAARFSDMKSTCELIVGGDIDGAMSKYSK